MYLRVNESVHEKSIIMILEMISSNFVKIFTFDFINFGKLLINLTIINEIIDKNIGQIYGLLYHCNSNDEYVLLSRLNK